jgi:divalent metal cation (Fe/Co/Zn/Cd) transporter
LYEGFTVGPEASTIDLTTVLVILAVIFIKSGLWIYCRLKAGISETVETLAFDHRNDVLSNIVACAAIAIVKLNSHLWWMDAVGCIAISIYIAQNWYELAMDKVDELVGRTADSAFIAELTQFINNYHSVMRLDIIRAYHFGVKYLVEVEVILPADMTVREAHDLSLSLQHEIELMDGVERAFVHVDYASRSIDEHDVNEMALHAQSLSESSSGSKKKDSSEIV